MFNATEGTLNFVSCRNAVVRFFHSAEKVKLVIPNPRLQVQDLLFPRARWYVRRPCPPLKRCCARARQNS